MQCVYKEDIMNKWVQITSGRGPEECRMAVGRVYQELCKEVGEFGLSLSIEHAESSSYVGNYKSIIIKLQGPNLDSFLKNWIGSVKWIEKSPYRKSGRKNWFVGINEIKMPKSSDISLDEIEIKAIRSSGKGGQNVNKVNSAVQITHLPSGLVIKCQDERSQKMNKTVALQRLKEVLEGKVLNENNKIMFENWMQHNTLIRGEEVRVFKN
jgi:peptide chain release factor